MLDRTFGSCNGLRCGAWAGREHKGVKVRIECGPKEADRGQCVLAVTTTAGSVAQKRTFSVRLPLTVLASSMATARYTHWLSCKCIPEQQRGAHASH